MVRTFGHSDNDQGDCDDEDVDEGDTLLVGSPGKTSALR